MNMKKRCDVVRAMDLLAGALNDGQIYNSWLIGGVADGDIDEYTTDEDLDRYTEDDDDFADLMDTFLALMSSAYKSGGLYVDGVVSKEAD